MIALHRIVAFACVSENIILKQHPTKSIIDCLSFKPTSLLIKRICFFGCNSFRGPVSQLPQKKLKVERSTTHSGLMHEHASWRSNYCYSIYEIGEVDGVHPCVAGQAKKNKSFGVLNCLVNSIHAKKCVWTWLKTGFFQTMTQKGLNKEGEYRNHGSILGNCTTLQSRRRCSGIQNGSQ
ncbi:hypothetical protein BCR41DRAFT_371410 [Lobosporangium transversale]|uniref:Uncharacterized protein n=1 Tax=Lobosporangium transversale TaxID=64571 RepID=A0A1Y2GN22_9FUNG|nr:hypothetical protein BCR41DRAFT_371410 [Lobosporangium transversale]ORZ13900.1 hypothetical protein BCR41DRAFT_371410 [Lobosporangium transversale]|eukprot:XP_021880684.1 hypothetical protein BCR41DRAFT_371410 [Lobosporangium transversale]